MVPMNGCFSLSSGVFLNQQIPLFNRILPQPSINTYFVSWEKSTPQKQIKRGK